MVCKNRGIRGFFGPSWVLIAAAALRTTGLFSFRRAPPLACSSIVSNLQQATGCGSAWFHVYLIFPADLLVGRLFSL